MEENNLKICKPTIQSIKESYSGNPLYCMIEKIAFYFHQKCPSKNQNENWFAAQKELEKFLDFNFELYPSSPNFSNPQENTMDQIIRLVGTFWDRQDKKIADPAYEIAQRIVDAPKILYLEKLFS